MLPRPLPALARAVRSRALAPAPRALAAAAAEAARATRPPPTPAPPTPEALAAAAENRRPPLPAPALRFDDPAAAFAHLPTGALLRSWLVLRACAVGPLVAHADGLLSLGRRLLGQRALDALIRATFFRQLCAGEDEAGLAPTVALLRANGIGAILDYAAEGDSPEAGKPAADASAAAGGGANGGGANGAGGAVARTYTYESEAACDAHVAVFLKAIAAAAASSAGGGPGFAAIKVTALGNPRLLRRMSTSLLEIRALFARADRDGSGFVTRAEFQRLCEELGPCSAAFGDRAFSQLDPCGSGSVDFLGWTERIRLQDAPRIADRIRASSADGCAADGAAGGAGAAEARTAGALLTDEEVRLAEALLARLGTLAAAAAHHGVRIMVDAEHSYFQPARAVSALQELGGGEGEGARCAPPLPGTIAARPPTLVLTPGPLLFCT